MELQADANMSQFATQFANVNLHRNASLPLETFRNASTNNAQMGLIALPIVSLLINSAVVGLLLKGHDRRSPFDIYIIALLLTDTLYPLLNYPQKLVVLTRDYQIGHPACTFYLYFIYAFPALIVHMHLLILINRAWAVFFPVSYRLHHTHRLAYASCVMTTVYIHAAILPAIILDGLYYRLPHGCILNVAQQTTWNLLTQIIVYRIPKYTVPLSYPILLWRIMRTRRRLIRAVSVRAPPFLYGA
ncbi:uncharacterized protein LOC129592643 [Paramacrobiotus metropolitanus]|uniref:uncharacterized protein LOC129592643 n=1 Tax=Paramacrobiotus metropolitanus TaxID=2943436 RepID=UPI0024458230|nr:uncharacterized protein LOC129592643 [Paramacrobiotus metropolitanus]